MEVLIDTNIILDWFLKREDFYEDAKTLLNKIWFGRENHILLCIQSAICFISLTNHFQLTKKRNSCSFWSAEMKLFLKAKKIFYVS